ncbi:MAG: hypothetical protein Tsb0021_14540 [Chlamydiales bacterium]
MSKALITGASSGIGRALSQLLSHEGYQLILHGRNISELDSLAQELGKGTTWVSADLSVSEERKKVMEAIHEEQPDLCVFNAGFGLYGPVLEHTLEQESSMVEVNVTSIVELCISTLQLWKEKKIRGTILNVSSVAAFTNFPYFATYAASKAFVLHFSRSLNEEVKDRGIRVLASCPGVVKTHFRERAAQGNPIQQKSWGEMDVEYSAQRMWKQIQKGKQVDIFDWRYRFLVFVTQYLIPYSWQGNISTRMIERLYESPKY